MAAFDLGAPAFFEPAAAPGPAEGEDYEPAQSSIFAVVAPPAPYVGNGAPMAKAPPAQRPLHLPILKGVIFLPFS